MNRQDDQIWDKNNLNNGCSITSLRVDIMTHHEKKNKEHDEIAR